jgi:phage gp29-like protein
MKWFVVGEIGEAAMKKVMDEQKDRLKKRLEDRAPAILLQAPRDVRKPLHDALGFADDTVDAMAAATPDAMDDVTGQILKVLADSKDFTDAKRRMLDAFPTLDRTKLRDVLTGGMLIAQAMGHESVKREVSK